MHLDAAQRAADVAAMVVMAAVAEVVVQANPVKASRLTVTTQAMVDALQPSAQHRAAAVVPLAAVAVDLVAAIKATLVAMAAATTSSPAISATMLAAT